MSINEEVKIFKALADENRLAALKFLQNGEKCACHLLEALNISQPTLSHHMKQLCESGLVSARKEGTWMHYSISSEGREKLCSIINEYLGSDNDCCCCCKENDNDT